MRLLLSSPVGPLPSFVGGRDNLRSNYANTTYGQDVFSVPTETHPYGLHLIAQNISADTLVLENPSREDFERELAQGYDIVGIHFLIPFFSKVVEMCRMVRRLSPQSRIVLGGHGVQCLAHATGREDELLLLADDICRGEGVRFFRELLGQDVDAPIVQDLPLNAAVPFGFGPLRQAAPVLVSTLGCANRCEFCASSAFFEGRRVKLASPAELFAAIRSYLERYEFSTANLYDENFLSDRRYVRELGRLIRADPLCRERGFGYYTFASLDAIRRYTAEELVACGVSALLIGVESKFTEKLAPHIARKKRDIDTKAVFDDLLDHGIRIDGSLILGWDFHDHQTIVEDIDAYVALGATSDQIVPLVPAPGTALWRKLAEEGRLSPDIDWDEAGFYTHWMRYAHLTHEELWHYQELGERKAYETWGPTYLRLMDLSLRGFRKFKDHPDPYLRSRADFHRRRCLQLYPLLLSMDAFAPSEAVRERVHAVDRAIRQELGHPGLGSTLLGVGALGLVASRKVRHALVRQDTFQPRRQRFHYAPLGGSGPSVLVRDGLSRRVGG